MSKYNCRNVPVVTKKDEKVEGKGILKSVMFAGVKDDKFMSIFAKTNVSGPNTNLAKGPKDDLLL